MYNNDIYSGEGAGTYTSGASSQQNQSDQNNSQSSTSTWGGNQYQTYHSEDNSTGNANNSYNSSSNSSYGSNSYNNSYSSNNYGSGSYGNSYSSNSGDDNKKSKKKEKKSSGFFHKAITCVALGLFFGLFAGVGFYGVQYVTGSIVQEEANEPVISGNVENSAQNATDDMAAEESKSGIKITDTTEVRVVSSDVSDVVDEVMPAMVSIINKYTETTSFFGQSYSEEKAASGSGIIVAESDTELLVVTNHHVVSDAEKLEVTFIDSTTAEAQIKGLDSDMDLAVIAIPLDSLTEETKDSIAIATLGDSDSLKLGEPVIAIGNALGYGQSVTNGIVSALDREISMEDGSTGTFIQTNAAINPGNSGGALLNVNGEVIGINSNKIGATAVEGMCYAIPISAAKPIIAELMLKETRTKVEDGQVGYIGISMQTIDSTYSQMLGLPIGVYIVGVEEGSPAKEAGLQMGDIIVKFEGEKITTHQDLQSVLQYYGSGSEVVITVKRAVNGEYQEVELKVTLGTRPDSLQ